MMMMTKVAFDWQCSAVGRRLWMRLNDASVIVAQGDANHWSNAAYNGKENDDYSSDGEGKEDFVYLCICSQPDI